MASGVQRIQITETFVKVKAQSTPFQIFHLAKSTMWHLVSKGYVKMKVQSTPFQVATCQIFHLVKSTPAQYIHLPWSDCIVWCVVAIAFTTNSVVGAVRKHMHFVGSFSALFAFTAHHPHTYVHTGVHCYTDTATTQHTHLTVPLY